MSEQPPSLPPKPPAPDPYQAPSAETPPHPQQAETLGDNAGIRMLLPVGRSGWAIAAGYLGLFSMILLPAPIAVIISLIAIWDIKRSKEKGKSKHGLWRAIFGLVMGILFSLVLAGIITNILL